MIQVINFIHQIFGNVIISEHDALIFAIGIIAGLMISRHGGNVARRARRRLLPL